MPNPQTSQPYNVNFGALYRNVPKQTTRVEQKKSKEILILSRNLNENGDINLNWVYFIRTILNECGFTYIYGKQKMLNIVVFIA
jgi:hypothetical protein